MAAQRSNVSMMLGQSVVAAQANDHQRYPKAWVLTAEAATLFLFTKILVKKIFSKEEKTNPSFGSKGGPHQPPIALAARETLEATLCSPFFPSLSRY